MPLWFGGPPDSSHPNSGDANRRAPRYPARDATARDTLIKDPDHHLIEAIRFGDDRAFESLVHTYAADITRFAYDYVGSSDIAEDIVDDIFVWVWDNRSEWQVHGTVRSYLFGAIRNRALSSRRDAAYRAAWISHNAQDPAAAGVGSATRDVAADLEIQELGTQLCAAIDSLSEGRRTAVLVRWIQEMSYAEIA